VHSVVSRLCSTIEGTSPAQLAQCLGLNPASFQKSELAQDEEDGFQVGVKGEERFKVLSVCLFSVCVVCMCGVCSIVLTLYTADNRN